MCLKEKEEERGQMVGKKEREHRESGKEVGNGTSDVPMSNYLMRKKHLNQYLTETLVATMLCESAMSLCRAASLSPCIV